MSLFARIAQRLLGRPETDDQSADQGQSGGRRRRRGRRGGRGRRRNAGESRTETAATTTTNNTNTNSANRNRRGRYSGRGRRLPNAFLDNPLPEDVAFRPATEGGDDSILPSRRRRPPGLHATKRVMLGGSRYVTGFSTSEAAEASKAPAPEREPENDGAADDGSGERRRRRGRRGGRGRRRGGSDSADAAQ